MLAAYALMGEGGDLAGEAPEVGLVEVGRGHGGDGAAHPLDPELAGPVDVEVGHRRIGQPRRQRRQVGLQIDPHRGVMDHFRPRTPEKSRSRATKIVTGAPWGVLMVGEVLVPLAALAMLAASDIEPM